jgi:hypothetical protein
MSYILNERIPLEKSIFIHEMPFKEFKQYCKSCSNDDERKILFNKMKRICNENITNNGSVTREYKYSNSMEHFGRLCSNGMQGVKKSFRGFLMSDTTDIDMDNAHPVILSYICKKNKIDCPNVDYYNDNREEVLCSFPDKTRAEAKTHLLKCINNDKHNKNDKHEFYRKWDNETKKLQIALGNIEEYKMIAKTVPDDRDYNIKGSTMSRILCTVEDKVLQVVLKIIEKEKLETATLMYDGCMIYGDHYNNTELLEKITAGVEAEFTGLNMKWSYKPHNKDIVVPDGWKSKKMEKLLKLTIPVEKDEVKKEEIVGVMEGDDFGASEIILKAYPHWKCCNDVLYVFDDETGMWSDKVDIHNRVISRYSEYLDIIKMNNEGELKRTGRNYARNNQKRKDIFPFIRENCVDNDWIVRTETSSLGKILFLNGHYDFKRGTFITGRQISGTDNETKNTVFENGFNPEIVFFYRVDHEFTHFTDDDMEYMETIRERLFTLPLGESVGDYLIRILARALSGETMKKILFGLGMSNSGKGILTKACQLSMGQYCGVFTGENLAFNNVNNDEAQKLRWAMLLRNKRLIISNELSTRKNLDGNLIKRLASGGDTIQGRLHGQVETDFKPQYLAILLANDMPEIKPFDTALQNRVRVYSYTKSFVDEPTNEYELKKDPNLDNEMKTRIFQRCFIGLLIKSHLQFMDDGAVDIEPDEVLVARNDWLGSVADNSIITKFQEFYEITNNSNDYVQSKDMERFITNLQDVSYKKFAMELKKHCVVNTLLNVRNNVKKINNKGVQVWFGIKPISDNYDVNDDLTVDL